MPTFLAVKLSKQANIMGKMSWEQTRILKRSRNIMLFLKLNYGFNIKRSYVG